jgi:MarR-like DNA-binding transcriptional regulator SgrR of sgrS sRNA
LTEKSSEKLRVNPGEPSYHNLDEITTSGDYEVTFHLKRPQRYLIALSLPTHEVLALRQRRSSRREMSWAAAEEQWLTLGNAPEGSMVVDRNS